MSTSWPAGGTPGYFLQSLNSEPVRLFPDVTVFGARSDTTIVKSFKRWAVNEWFQLFISNTLVGWTSGWNVENGAPQISDYLNNERHPSSLLAGILLMLIWSNPEKYWYMNHINRWKHTSRVPMSCIFYEIYTGWYNLGFRHCGYLLCSWW